MFPPDQFFYFIALFTLNICCATYLWFTYNRNTMLWLNAIAFLLVGFRCCTEYYLPQVDTFQIAHQIAIAHSIAALLMGGILWYSAWEYIQPFRGKPYQFKINKLYYSLMAMAILFSIVVNRKIYEIQPEKIEGYWKFIINYDTAWTIPYYIASIGFGFITVLMFIVDFVRTKQKRLGKFILILCFSIFPYLLYDSMMGFNRPSVYSIPNTAFIYTLNLLIANWFFTDYRLFRDTSEEIISDSFNSISDLVIFTDFNFNIKQSNDQANLFFNITEDHHNLLQLITSKSRMIDTEVLFFFKSLEKKIGSDKELTILLNNEEKLLSIKLTPYLKGDQVFGYTFFIRDITEERAKEQLLASQNDKLKQLNVIKDHIFNIIGHDLKKPAIAFRNITQKVNYLLKKEDYNTLNKFGKEIELQAQGLHKLTDNLLNWALTQKDVIPYHPSTILLFDVVSDNVLFFESNVREKQVKLINDVSNGTTAYADRNSLVAILRNLIDNAIKYTQAGDTISISATAMDQEVLIQVADTGVGMTKQQQQHIFSLEKGKSTKGTKEESGTGLGLFLINEMVHLNKGQIRVDSQLNVGTTFSIILPIN